MELTPGFLYQEARFLFEIQAQCENDRSRVRVVIYNTSHQRNMKNTPALGRCGTANSLLVRFRTLVQDTSFFNKGPGPIRIIRFHLLRDVGCLRSEVLLIDFSLLIDNKGHDP